jgi:hypothetical protein
MTSRFQIGSLGNFQRGTRVGGLTDTDRIGRSDRLTVSINPLCIRRFPVACANDRLSELFEEAIQTPLMVH